MGCIRSDQALHADLQYMPLIKINEALMDDMTDEEKETWCQSDPAKTFKFNQNTRKVRPGAGCGRDYLDST